MWGILCLPLTPCIKTKSASTSGHLEEFEKRYVTRACCLQVLLFKEFYENFSKLGFVIKVITEGSWMFIRTVTKRASTFLERM